MWCYMCVDNEGGLVPHVVVSRQQSMDMPRPRHAHTITDLENSAQVENTMQGNRHQTICSLSVELIVTVHAVVRNHGYHKVYSFWVSHLLANTFQCCWNIAALL